MIRNEDVIIVAAVNRLHIDINFISIKIVEIWNSFMQNYSKLKKHHSYINALEMCVYMNIYINYI